MEAKKPKGFGKFNRLMKKLVKPEPQRCNAKGCKQPAMDGHSMCKGCRDHFEAMTRD